jgi:hypothetical protein
LPSEHARRRTDDRGVNATDGDAGLQVFLDGEPWKAVTIFRPDGRRMLDVATRGQLRDYGLTELFTESTTTPPR